MFMRLSLACFVAVQLASCSLLTDFDVDCTADAECADGQCVDGFCDQTGNEDPDLPDMTSGGADTDSTSSDECKLYCDRMDDACSSVFDTKDACLGACAEYPSEPEDIIDGGPRAYDDNTVQCRSYHAVNALADADTHCPHASPDGGGVCVDFKGSCGEYCGIVVETCAAADGAFADVMACENECNLWPEGFPADETGNTRQCRLTFAKRAQTDPSQCDLALTNSAACR